MIAGIKDYSNYTKGFEKEERKRPGRPKKVTAIQEKVASVPGTATEPLIQVESNTMEVPHLHLKWSWLRWSLSHQKILSLFPRSARRALKLQICNHPLQRGNLQKGRVQHLHQGKITIGDSCFHIYE
jgi:hypothetical protein